MSNKELEDVLTVQEIKPYYDSKVALNLAFVDITGSLTAGLLLSQIVYWYGKPKNGNGNPTRLTLRRDGKYWLAKNRGDWWDEIRLTLNQYRGAIKRLKQLNLVEVLDKSFAGRRTSWIRIKSEVLQELLEERQ